MAIKTDFVGNRINSFQALRGIAALLIIAEHVSFLKCGVFGVDIFFVLSGFMIMYSTEKGMDHFLIKRLIRIVPFYWLITLVTFLGANLVPGMFESTRAGVKELLCSLFFIPFDMNTGTSFAKAVGMPVIQPLMRIGWTLNLEMLFYLLFLLAAKLSFKLRALFTSGFLLSLIVIGAFVPSPAFILWGNPLTLEFIFGMALFYICKALSQKNISRKASVISSVVSLIIIALFGAFELNRIAMGEERALIWGLGALALVFLAYIYERNLEVPKGLVWLGDISFSIYYVHYYLIQIFNRFTEGRGLGTLTVLCLLLLTVVLTIILSYVAWLIIEKKLTGFLKHALTK